MKWLYRIIARLPSYEEWSQVMREREYESKLSSARCQYVIEKEAVYSFEDIKRVKNLEGFVRYADSYLNDYFGVK